MAGGGVIYSGANDVAGRILSNRPASRSRRRQAGRVHCRTTTRSESARSVRPERPPPTRWRAEADVVIGIGTRYSDFTTASRTAFNDPEVRFVNINVASLDAVKQGGPRVVADAREALEALARALAITRSPTNTGRAQLNSRKEWDARCRRPTTWAIDGEALNQSQVIGLANTLSDPRDVVVCAAGSMPGDLHKLWRTRDRKGYHVEYGYSCMGYEVAGGIGVGMAIPDRDVFVMVGDGSYLMMATELVTAVQEGIKVIVVLVQNHGFASIGSLSESLGSQRFGTAYRYRSEDGRLDGAKLPVDLAANAASLGADVIRATTAAEFTDAVKVAKANERTTVIHVETDPLVFAPDSESWWDVPVSQTSTLDSTKAAYETYAEWKKVQRPFGEGPPNEHHSRRLGTRFVGRLVPRRPRQTPVQPLPGRGRRIRLSVDRVRPLRLPAHRPAKLSDELASRNLKLSAGTVFEHLHRPNSWRSDELSVEADRGRGEADRRRRWQACRRHSRDVARSGDRRVLEDRTLTPEQWRKKTGGMNASVGRCSKNTVYVRNTTHTPTAT